MAGLNVRFFKVFNHPVSPDKVTFGEVNITPVVINQGDYTIPGNVGVKTITFDLAGISLANAENIRTQANANMEAYMTGGTPTGGFVYRGYNCFAIKVTDNGSLSIGAGNAETLLSFPVQCLTDFFEGSIG